MTEGKNTITATLQAISLIKVREKLSVTLQFALICLFIPSFLISNSVSAYSAAPVIDWGQLHGVNTVVIRVTRGPIAKLSDPLFSKFNGEDPNSVVSAAIKGEFSGLRGLIVDSSAEFARKKLAYRENVLEISFKLSVREDTVGNGEKIEVGSLSVRFTRFDSRGQGKDISTVSPASYPFVVAGDQVVFQEKLSAAATYLTSFVPTLIACANVDTSQEENCTLKVSQNLAWRE